MRECCGKPLFNKPENLSEWDPLTAKVSPVKTASGGKVHVALAAHQTKFFIIKR